MRRGICASEDSGPVAHGGFHRCKRRLPQEARNLTTELLKPSEQVREDAAMAVRHLFGRQLPSVVVDAGEVQGTPCRADEGPESAIARQAPLADEIVGLSRDGAEPPRRYLVATAPKVTSNRTSGSPTDISFTLISSPWTTTSNVPPK